MQVKRTPRRGPARGKGRAALSAQQTVPYLEMLKDGVCRVRDGYYTKTIAYEDINYSVASTEDQAAIFSGWCSFLNYFDSALPFQLSFVNHRSRGGGRYKVNIPMAHAGFGSLPGAYVGMVERQIVRGKYGLCPPGILRAGSPPGPPLPPGPWRGAWRQRMAAVCSLVRGFCGSNRPVS